MAQPLRRRNLRKGAITKRLVIVIGLLAGAVFALFLQRYMAGNEQSGTVGPEDNVGRVPEGGVILG